MRLIRLPNSPNWYLDFTDHNGARHKLTTGTRARDQAQRYADKVEHLIHLRAADEPLDPPTLAWIARLPLRKRDQLAESGVLNEAPRRRPLLQYVARYEVALRDAGIRASDAKEAAARCRRVIEALGATSIDHLTPAAVQGDLASRRRQGLSPTTSNHYLKQLKAFIAWLIREGKARNHPLKHVRKLAEAQGTRRALTPEELEKLLKVTHAGPDRFGMTGSDRAMLYRFAVETGLRADELRRLRVADFDFGGRTVTVRPKPGQPRPKVREIAHQPIRADTAEEMMKLWSGRDPVGPAFRVPASVSKMFAVDLEDAGIPRTDPAGRVLVFHSLRHTFGTDLARSGAYPAVAQRLMRHRAVQMTMAYYTHVLSDDAQAAVEALRPLQITESSDTPESATGR